MTKRFKLKKIYMLACGITLLAFIVTFGLFEAKVLNLRVFADTLNPGPATSSPFVSVKTFGAKGDGVSDDTAAIQQALNSSYSVYFPSGNYVTKALTVKDNSYIFGDGQATILRYKDGESATLFDCGTKVVQFNNFEIDGGSNTTKQKISTPGKRNAIKISNYAHRSMISNLIIHGFDNAAIMIGGGSHDRLNNLQIQNTQVYYSYYGVYESSPIQADHIQIDNLDAHSNRAGLWISSGNAIVTNLKSNDNGFGVMLYGTGEVNNGQGNISSALLNHNLISIYALDITYGFTIIGANIVDEGSIYLKNSSGISITNSIIDTSNYYFEGGGMNIIKNNHILGKRANTINHNYKDSADKTKMIDNYKSDGSYVGGTSKLLN